MASRSPPADLRFTQSVEVHIMINGHRIKSVVIQSPVPWSEDKQRQFGAMMSQELTFSICHFELTMREIEEACDCMARARQPEDPLKTLHSSTCGSQGIPRPEHRDG